MKKFNIDKFVNEKIDALTQTDKSFKQIYELMFRDGDFNMFEWTDGSRIKYMTYSECKKEIECISRGLRNKLKDVKKGTMVGLYAQNSIRWVQVFWAIMKCGYKPLLLNTRLDLERINDILKCYDVSCVISDGQNFGENTILIDEIELIYEGNDIDEFENELIVMSSGTTLKSKLCVYNGINFFYQLIDSANIIKICKPIKKHYEGNLKQLMFLPLYHIFGLAAMFMWFAFFSRTFVLLKDQNPETIILTIRKHKVTHIFAVPLFWEVVYKKFKATLATQDQKTIQKVNKGLVLVKKLKSKWLGRKLFGQIREKIFGESICFLISGGSAISSEILTFFNSIGYHIANGYGMSEVGITSVELTSSFNKLTDCSVGKPFSHVEYKLDESGTLLVKGPSTAHEIYINGKKQTRNDGWYNTLDKAKCKNGRYFICGREDDMIVGADGENINPAWLEKQISLNDVEDVCLLKMDNKPTLLIQISKYISSKKISEIKAKAQAELIKLNVEKVVQTILFTNENFIQGNDFKLNRQKVSKLKIIDENSISIDENLQGEIIDRIREIFAKILGIDIGQIKDNSHFFFDLNGNSLDYFSLLSSIQTEFGVKIFQDECEHLHTVKDFLNFIQKDN